jgi:hypothetical protein
MKTIIVCVTHKGLPSEGYVFVDSVGGRSKARSKFDALTKDFSAVTWEGAEYRSNGDTDVMMFQSENDMELF